MVRVDYCAFGREYPKPTCLWTNSGDPAHRLAAFTCKQCCACADRHPDTVRCNRTSDHGAIPGPLAELVAQLVDALLEREGARATD